jgi:acetylornithine deacetylase/succinyl-diaminopimelate desuccinylase-like protein
VLRTESHFTLSIRLPPTVNSHKATAAVKALLEKDPPYGAKVEFVADEPANGWESPILADWLEKSITKQSNTFFGKPAVQMGEGGSIPFMGLLGEQFPKAQFVITGVLGPKSNAHGPNEFLHIEMFKSVTCIIAHVLNDFYVEKHKQ